MERTSLSFALLAIAGIVSFGGVGVEPLAADDTVQDFNATFFAPPEAQRFRLDQFGSDPAPSVDPDGWDDNFLRITEAVNSQLNVVAFNQVHSGEYDQLLIELEFRIDNGPGGADGIAVAYLNSEFYGSTTGDPTPSISEEPNLSGSFGVGFDTFNNAGLDEPDINASEPNSVSVHFDGAIVVSEPIDALELSLFETADPASVMSAAILVSPSGGDSDVTIVVTNTDTGDTLSLEVFVPGLTPYDGRLAIGARTGGANANQDVDNIVVTVSDGDIQTVVLEEDFEDEVDPVEPQLPEPTGGTGYQLLHLGSNPAPQISSDLPAPEEEEVRDGFLRLTHEVGSQAGLIVFDVTSDETDEITANFLLRGSTIEGSNRADGASFLLLDTEVYGEDEVFWDGFRIFEEPNLVGAFGVGFDTFNNNGGGDGVETPEPNIGNHVSLHWNGELVAVERFDREDIDLVANEFHEVRVALLDEGGSFTVSVSIVDGADGSEHTPFEDVLIEGMAFNGSPRVAFGARTGGAFDRYDIDEVNVVFPGGGGGGTQFRRGECNGDRAVNIADAIFLLNSLFGDGAAPQCTAAANVNLDGAVNIADAIYLLNHLFGDGNEPPAPFPNCGPGGAIDETLGCETTSPDCA